jgi:uncharacterized FAD-dependent dehydrogenase
MNSGKWVLKEYPSDYLSLPARLELTAEMVAAADADIIDRTEVLSARYCRDSDMFRVTLQDETGHRYSVHARRLLLATGRFGPLGLHGLTQHRSFRRLEVGIRIEQQADRAFFRNMRQLDPKLRFREHSGSVEWRTFCACRQGETVLTETLGLWTVSGRSDCPPTGQSNIGFNTRILSESLAQAVIAPAIAALADQRSHFVVPMTDLLRGEPAALAALDNVYGADMRSLIAQGLDRLRTRFPELDDAQTRLVGPTLEGIGWYPRVDGRLRLLDAPAWVAGDASGLFRGIVAAMISGHYAASAVLTDLHELCERAA